MGGEELNFYSESSGTECSFWEYDMHDALYLTTNGRTNLKKNH